MFKQDTIAAISTPPGEGGIALIRVSGPDALSIADRIFRCRGATVTAMRSHTVRYGTFVDAKGEIADDGLLTLFRAPHSYTGEDTAELSCHGGHTTTSRILALALQAGARPAEPGEFTLRAFLNGKLDLAQAEAVSDVIRARTESARRVARRHLDGALSAEITAIKQELIGILAAIEVTIDFSDEVGELEYGPLLNRITAAKDGIESLLSTSDRGRMLREGLHVAIIGRPNVGKSSLLNRLLRSDRAIVTPIAGTTRDLLEESASIAGVPVVLIDTAGIRDTEDPVERIGVQRAEAAAARADLILLVADATEGLTPEDRHLLSQVPNGVVRLLVWNKCDLLALEVAASLDSNRLLNGDQLQSVRVSAKSGMGLPELEQALLYAVNAGQSPQDRSEDLVVANVRHISALQQAGAGLAQAIQTTRERLPGDFIAIDIRGALDSLGQITGETVNEEIIHRIFHDFCVGK